MITVWDSVGNKAKFDELTGIKLDGNTPGVNNLFPAADAAPKDADNEDAPTIDRFTKNPSFQIDEDLDSLSIRYHKAGGGTVIVQPFIPGNPRLDLETAATLVRWPVNDTTFIDRQRYDLEVLAFDLAGNASVTKGGGLLTFKDAFKNPDADSFKIVPDADLEEKQIAGADYPITVSVLDNELTAIEEADVRAVTYHTPSALAAIVSGDQADALLEGASFSGTASPKSPCCSIFLPSWLPGAWWRRPTFWTATVGTRVRESHVQSPRSRSRT